MAPVLASDCRSVLIPSAAIDADEIRSAAVRTTGVLAKIRSDQAAALLQPILPRDPPAKVWYEQATRLSPALDPLETALNSLCDLAAHDKPLRGEDFSSLAGIVVVSPASMIAPPCSETCRVRRTPPPATFQSCTSPPAGTQNLAGSVPGVGRNILPPFH